jgi:hypothetical protein
VVAIYLDVGFESQLTFGNPADPAKDPTGCWYASLCMIGHYFEFGPRLGDPALYNRVVGTYRNGQQMIGHQPASQADWPTILQNEHMVAIPEPNSRTFSAADLAGFLRIDGPLAFRWTKTAGGQSYGHVSVLIGADSRTDELIIHDPENRPNFHLSTADLNAKLRWGNASGCLFRKEDGAYRMKGGLTVGSLTVTDDT